MQNSKNNRRDVLPNKIIPIRQKKNTTAEFDINDVRVIDYLPIGTIVSGKISSYDPNCRKIRIEMELSDITCNIYLPISASRLPPPSYQRPHRQSPFSTMSQSRSIASSDVVSTAPSSKQNNHSHHQQKALMAPNNNHYRHPQKALMPPNNNHSCFPSSKSTNNNNNNKCNKSRPERQLNTVHQLTHPYHQQIKSIPSSSKNNQKQKPGMANDCNDIKSESDCNNTESEADFDSDSEES